MCVLNSFNVTDVRTETIETNSSLFCTFIQYIQSVWSAGIPCFLGQPSGPFKQEWHTQTHRNLSVFLVWLRGFAWLFACLAALYLKKGRAREPHKPQTLPSSFFHYYNSQGDKQCCSHSSTISWASMILLFFSCFFQGEIQSLTLGH